MDVAAIFAKNLKQLRTDAGISRLALAEKLGVSELMIYNYEKPTNFPRVEILNSICRVFAIEPWKLLVDGSKGSSEGPAEISVEAALAIVVRHLGYDLRKRG